MSFNLSNFAIFIFGQSESKIKEMKNNFLNQNCIEIKLTNTTTINDKNIINYCVKNYPNTNHMLLVNSDTMKKVNIYGSEKISNIISKIKPYEDSFILLFNRYLDSGIQSHYVQEILKDVSLFRSFNPSYSDCFYLSKGLVDKLKNTLSPDLASYTTKIFDLVRDEKLECFSFNPNLYTFRIEDSTLTYSSHTKMSTMLKEETHINFNQDVSKFFSSHIILFWIFLVFFICTIYTICLKTLNLGSLINK